MSGSTEGDGDDLDAAFRAFLLHLSSGDVVGLEDLGELCKSRSDETGVAHDVENVGEGGALERIEEIRAERPFYVLVGG